MTQTSTSTTSGNLAASALEALPIFPLPGVVLLPGALMPLHVFEPRYRALLADCLATHKCMALALLVDDHADSGGQPSIARVAGVGMVVEHTALADGRSNIMVKGQGRALLKELPFQPPYRRAYAHLLESNDGPVSTLDHAALRGAAFAYASAARRVDRSIELALPPGLDAGSAADLCAHHLIVDVAARQQTLEELDVAARVRFVTAVLAEQTARLKRGRSALD